MQHAIVCRERHAASRHKESDFTEFSQSTTTASRLEGIRPSLMATRKRFGHRLPDQPPSQRSRTTTLAGEPDNNARVSKCTGSVVLVSLLNTTAIEQVETIEQVNVLKSWRPGCNDTGHVRNSGSRVRHSNVPMPLSSRKMANKILLVARITRDAFPSRAILPHPSPKA